MFEYNRWAIQFSKRCYYCEESIEYPYYNIPLNFHKQIFIGNRSITSDVDYSIARCEKCYNSHISILQKRVRREKDAVIRGTNSHPLLKFARACGIRIHTRTGALETKKMPITLYMILSDTVLKGDRKIFRIVEDLELIRLFSYRSMTGISKSQVSTNWHSFNSILLKLTTLQSFDHNFYGDVCKKDPLMHLNIGEYQEILNRIRYFMLSFYLNGYQTMREGLETFNPWWIKEDFKKFKTSDIRYKHNILELNDLNQLKDLFNKIVKLDLFKDKELELVLFNYNELHKKDLVSELILYEFIILESIFTRGSTSELSFRLSLNLALFISESKEEFEKIFQISKKLYGIRSEIIHGGNWPSRLRNKRILELLGLDNKVKKEVLARAVHEHLMKYINRAIRKVIQLKIDQIKISNSLEIMQGFRDLYFLLNSKIFKI